MTNQVTTAPKKSLSFADFMTTNKISGVVENVIKDKQRGTRFVSGIISAVNTNSALQECTNQSILSGALLGESLNLSPSPQLGMFYLVPYNDKEKGKVAQFQMGWKGYYQLALRSGQYKKLNVIEIKKGELIKWNLLEEEIELRINEDDAERESLPTIGYYAFYENLQGFRKAMYWSKEKMLAHADTYSKAFNKEAYKKLQEGKIPEKDMWKYSSFWYKNFDEMAKKTMLRQLISKYGVMSTELQSAYINDMSMINEDGSNDYVDSTTTENKTITIDVEEVEEKPKTLDEIVAE